MEFVHNASARPSGSTSEQGIITCHQLHVTKRVLARARTEPVGWKDAAGAASASKIEEAFMVWPARVDVNTSAEP